MSYETQYAARMMMKGQHAEESPAANERRRLENIALDLAEADVKSAFSSGITPHNAKEILTYQRNRIAIRKSELGF
ncbi:hypothetical protein [Marinobacter sp. ELB17]|uniref:hypothetical protein n=1 Tax=Marinobacter sp. ELB17 TaxID=270374 RepID=UPI0000F361BA|nr:hypothetical protein [Marinobacter sp. ELB17]EAZ97635.1 hypothetical protein MELB17_23922 [Marinobacter sp. ELB17]EAZ97654.1 hypothetical protein MELB17_24017 [Marinobacter sp. ELB17]EAZ97671.1 hypothetical protein MELB17_24102 [Marinobacter sp. ELB17]